MINLVTVLVGAGLEADLVAQHLMIASENISIKIINGVAEMRRSVDIRNSGGNIDF